MIINRSPTPNNAKMLNKEMKNKIVLRCCDQCGKDFRSNRGYYYHRHTHEKNYERLKCSECSADFAAPGSLYLHVKSIHGKVKFPCEHCGYKATSKQSLERHTQSLHLKVKFKCEHCDAILSKEYLYKHIKAVHDKRKYVCDQCPGKEYTFSHSLKKHKDAVHNGVYHMCDICDLKTSTKFRLKTHKKRHHSNIITDDHTSSVGGELSVTTIMG